MSEDKPADTITLTIELPAAFAPSVDALALESDQSREETVARMVGVAILVRQIIESSATILDLLGPEDGS